MFAAFVKNVGGAYNQLMEGAITEEEFFNFTTAAMTGLVTSRDYILHRAKQQDGETKVDTLCRLTEEFPDVTYGELEGIIDQVAAAELLLREGRF